MKYTNLFFPNINTLRDNKASRPEISLTRLSYISRNTSRRRPLKCCICVMVLCCRLSIRNLSSPSSMGHTVNFLLNVYIVWQTLVTTPLPVKIQPLWIGGFVFRSTINKRYPRSSWTLWEYHVTGATTNCSRCNGVKKMHPHVCMCTICRIRLTRMFILLLLLSSSRRQHDRMYTTRVLLEWGLNLFYSCW